MNYKKRLKTRKIKTILRWVPFYIHKILPHKADEKIQLLQSELLVDASWNTNYIACTICACLIATFGLLSNSTAVIIGAMVVAPLMLPLRALAFASCEGNLLLFRKAFLSILGATILALLLSSFIGIIVTIPAPGSEILARTQPNLIDLGIALAAGGMSGFAKVRSSLSDTLAGTAIAVALMPPLCVVGLSLSQGYYYYAIGAFLLYITNLLGIALACMFIFIVAGYTKVNAALGWASSLTALLIIPLGASFVQLIQQQRLEAEITRRLTQETITVGQSRGNTRIEVIWTKKPPLVSVFLETEKQITPNQVQLVKNYINKKMGKVFDVLFYVIPVQKLIPEESMPTSSDENNPSQNLGNGEKGR